VSCMGFDGVMGGGGSMSVSWLVSVSCFRVE
jgi:hypothetical protein